MIYKPKQFCEVAQISSDFLEDLIRHGFGIYYVEIAGEHRYLFESEDVRAVAVIKILLDQGFHLETAIHTARLELMNCYDELEKVIAERCSGVLGAIRGESGE